MRKRKTLGTKLSKNWVRDAYERKHKVKDEFMRPLSGDEEVIKADINHNDTIGKLFIRHFGKK